VYQRRHAQELPGGHGDQPGEARPDRVRELEGGTAVAGEYRAYGPRQRPRPANVMDVRTGKLPLARLRFVGESEYVHFVLARQAGKERQQCRNHPILGGSVDPSRHYQSYSHLGVADTMRRRPTYDTGAAR
jgi:hypothetical protein